LTVFGSRETRKRVHLREAGDTGGAWHAEGDLKRGWRIVSITPSNVTIMATDRAVILEMYPSFQMNAEIERTTTGRRAPVRTWT
jgi:hypothetical protein